ncbi:uncharacterized protein LOC128300545 [Anopheles moucheti]|uniref:uncharacterized protein LOC128300545 n=1 Tax=Anopheles moucheti TaxID=186751 RepID=UPI0022F11998|nr:uncharacterized protein LOC128300545 [Anopheles moucheti]
MYALTLEDICPEIQVVFLPHPDPTLCHVFVVCLFGQPMVNECVEGFVYDSSLLSCIPGDREQCVDSSEPNWRQICTDVSYAFLADPKSCWNFVFCSYGTVNHLTCPVGEIWSQRDGSCLPGNRKTCELQEVIETCQDRSDGVLPHPHDCSRYLECSRGVTTVVDCMHGEVFDNVFGKCVVGNTKTCRPHEDICNHQRDGEAIKHPNECGLFVKCEKGTAVLSECPAGEIFNNYAKNCAPGDAYTCDVSPMDTICHGKKNGTIIPLPDSCDRFVRCSDGGVPIIWNCTEGTILHAPSGDCRPGNVQTCEFIEDACRNKPNGWVMEHPNFCQVFIRCESQSVTIGQCLLGEILRPDVQVCVPGMPFACTYDPIERMCNGRPDGQVYPHPTRCQSYIGCSSSRSYVMNCTLGTIYRATTQRCVAGNANTCSYLDDTCVGRPDGVMAHPQSCELFLKCVANTTSAFDCPPGQVFHPEQLVCTVGNVDDCTMAPGTTASPIGMFCQDRPDGYYAHPLVCYQFFSCNKRDTLIISCPNNLIFDGAIKSCVPGNHESCIRL